MANPDLSFAPADKWMEACKQHLAKPLTQGDSHGDPWPLADVTFACGRGQRVRWGGLQYLATLSKVIPRGDGDHRTIIMPDFSVVAVRKFLLLLSKGNANITQAELLEMQAIAQALGVSKQPFYYPHLAFGEQYHSHVSSFPISWVEAAGERCHQHPAAVLQWSRHPRRPCPTLLRWIRTTHLRKRQRLP